jgi:serine acetyltransferase
MTMEVSDDLIRFAEQDELFLADLRVWWRWRNKGEFSVSETLRQSVGHPEFCTLAYYRIKQSGGDPQHLMPPKCRRANDLQIIVPHLGGGCRIQHGHSTWVFAEAIGENFHVNQNVTIGAGWAGGKFGKPTIGSNVKVHTGAVVTGPITVGDNVTIAPTAFVNFDVPSGSKVFAARSTVVAPKSKEQKREATDPVMSLPEQSDLKTPDSVEILVDTISSIIAPKAFLSETGSTHEIHDHQKALIRAALKEIVSGS